MRITKLKDLSTAGRVDKSQRGSAIVIALFVLALISVFVAYALSRTSGEALSVGNEVAESRTQYAAQGSLEKMTRDFNKVFETRLSPVAADIAAVEDPNNVPALSTAQGGNFTFVQDLLQVTRDTRVTLGNGAFAGLVATRDSWQLSTTARDVNSGTQVQLTRNILNNRIPIFQFGVFYDDDLELFNGPQFSFGGRVHTNRHFFLHPSANRARFDSRITAYGYIVTQTKKNGDAPNVGNNVEIADSGGVFQPLGLGEGSVLNGTPNVFAAAPFVDANLPPSAINNNWSSGPSPIRDRFDGNIVSRAPKLNLPMKVGGNLDLIELVKRGKNLGDLTSVDDGDNVSEPTDVAPVTTATMDNAITTSERFANKTGIRISLADSKANLPGCVQPGSPIPGACGVRLDGHMNFAPDGPGADGAAVDATRSKGLQPRSMKLSTADAGFGYTPTRVNGERLASNAPCHPMAGNCGVWIKIETVITDANGVVTTKDITMDFLSLGVTEQAVNINASFQMAAPYDATPPVDNLASPTTPAGNVPSTGTDSRSIIKLQRFVIGKRNADGTFGGVQIPQTSAVATARYMNYVQTVPFAGGVTAGRGYNVVERYRTVDAADLVGMCNGGTTSCTQQNLGFGQENYGHLKRATVNGVADSAIVPFPIQIFDAREGFHYDIAGKPAANYPNQNTVTRNGVMSMIDIDVANLRRFLRGDFNDLFPTGTAITTGTPFSETEGRGLLNTDIPQDRGWVVYISDRRGDTNFDGELDMEDVYGNGLGNDGVLNPNAGEDLDFLRPSVPVVYTGKGLLDGGAFPVETTRYRDSLILPDLAAVTDHRWFRRGVRLINGTILPGVYDSTNALNTRGFTVASENGVYVQGNYNSTGAAAPVIDPVTGTATNTPHTGYLPQNDPTHIPASIVGDAVTILSNNWNDAASFRTATVAPYNHAQNLTTGYIGRRATETTMRFAMIAGDTITTRRDLPHQGGSQNAGVFTDARGNGGLHNFKRFLEDWGGVRLNYSGSLINLFNSRNNNGSYKCCVLIYNAPTRNWVFDATFLDLDRNPPGTPFFQYVQTTGFLRTND